MRTSRFAPCLLGGLAICGAAGTGLAEVQPPVPASVQTSVQTSVQPSVRPAVRPAPLPPAAPSRRGEGFTFSLSLGPIEGGRARLAIAKMPGPDGRRLLQAVGEAEAVGLAKIFTGFNGDYRLTIDAETLVPRKLDIVETGLRTRTVHAQVNGARVDLHVIKPSGETHNARMLPSEVRDPVAALLVMRAQPLATGDRMDFLVLDGSAFYKGWVEVAGREVVAGPAGPRRAIRLRCLGRRLGPGGEVKTDRPPREVTLWLSDDADRVPLRMKGETDLGTAQIELTSYTPALLRWPRPQHLPGVVQGKAHP